MRRKLMDRIATMERDIILPIKAAGIAMLLYSFYFKRSWIGVKELGTLEITVASHASFPVGLHCRQCRWWPSCCWRCTRCRCCWLVKYLP